MRQVSVGGGGGGIPQEPPWILPLAAAGGERWESRQQTPTFAGDAQAAGQGQRGDGVLGDQRGQAACSDARNS